MIFYIELFVIYLMYFIFNYRYGLLLIMGVYNPISFIKKYNKSRLIICNHVSYYDLFILMYLIPNSFSIKKKKTSYLNYLYELSSIIIYDIGNKESGKSVKKQTKKLISLGENIILFPEGKMSNSCINKFKTGAIIMCYENDIPIQLLSIKYTYKNATCNEDKCKLKLSLFEIFSKIFSNKEVYVYDDYELIYPHNYKSFDDFYIDIMKMYREYEVNRNLYNFK